MHFVTINNKNFAVKDYDGTFHTRTGYNDVLSLVIGEKVILGLSSESSILTSPIKKFYICQGCTPKQAIILTKNSLYMPEFLFDKKIRQYDRIRRVLPVTYEEEQRLVYELEAGSNVLRTSVVSRVFDDGKLVAPIIETNNSVYIPTSY